MMLVRTARGACRSVLSARCVLLGQNLNEQAFAATSDATASEVSPVVSGKTAQRLAIASLGGLGAAALYWGLTDRFSQSEDQTTFVNWSHTHEVTPWRCVTPESEKEIEKLVKECHATGQKLRVVGSGLSPNGIAFTNQTMLDMSLMDKILHVDTEKRQVRLQCGARVETVVEALRPYGLTLQNYASIKEQQIGGFVQIGAHGTGAKIPPVDEQVISMKLITPGLGTIELSKDDPDPTLFYLARVGLGCFGVLAEVTLQCVPEHKLVEHTFVSSLREVKKQHSKWLKENQHLRYMWIPHTESVIVVQCNPLTASNAPRSTSLSSTLSQQTQAIRELIETRAVDGKVGEHAVEHLQELSFTELRDVALATAPLELEWVKRVNKAEADYRQKASGYRTGWSDQILGFDCGGQQWVLEVAFPTGSLSKPSLADIDFVEDLMQQIKQHKISAHAPIEQRWSSGSRSYLSPVYSTVDNDVHSWVGIIFYLPTDDPKVRQDITASFNEYAQKMETTLLPKYKGTWHWGKLEIDRVSPGYLKTQLRDKLPIEKADNERKRLDPNDIFNNRITNAIFST